MHSFRITVHTRLGSLSIRRETAEAALDTGRALEREGLGSVSIRAPDGREFDVADFEQMSREASSGFHREAPSAPQVD